MEACPFWLQQKFTSDLYFALNLAKDPLTPQFILQAMAQAGITGELYKLFIKGYHLVQPTMKEISRLSAEALLDHPIWSDLLRMAPSWFLQMESGALRALLRHPYCPEAALSGLSYCKKFYVKQAIAENPNASQALLTRLSYDNDPTVLLAVLQHPAAGAEILERLSRSRQENISIQAKLKNPNTSTEELCSLAGHEREDVRRLASKNPRCPKEYQALIEKASGGGYLTREELETLSSGGSLAKSMAASYDKAPPELLKSLIQSRDSSAIQQVFLRSDTPEELLLEAITAAKEPSLILELRKQKRISAAVIEKLVTHEHNSVRACFANRPEVPLSLLEKLYEDTSLSVISNAIENLKTPTHVLSYFAGNNRTLREAVARHPNTPEEALLRLLNDTKPRIRRLAAKHPKLPKHMLQTYQRAGANVLRMEVDYTRASQPRLKQRERELLESAGGFGGGLLKIGFSRSAMRRTMRWMRRHRGLQLKRPTKKDLAILGIKKK